MVTATAAIPCTGQTSLRTPEMPECGGCCQPFNCGDIMDDELAKMGSEMGNLGLMAFLSSFLGPLGSLFGMGMMMSAMPGGMGGIMDDDHHHHHHHNRDIG